MSELLSCPFCGGEGRLTERHNPMSKWRWSVDCASSTCGMSGPVESNRAEAIEAWNRRADPLVEKLRGALEPFAKAADMFPAGAESVCLTITSPPLQDPGRFGRVNASDFRRAREALALPDGGGASREPARSDDGGDQCSLATDTTANADAPDLYEALRALHDECLEAGAEDDLNLIRHRTMNAARAALSKSEAR